MFTDRKDAGIKQGTALEKYKDKDAVIRAVAEVYNNWYDVPDKEVIGIMKRWENERIQ